MWDLMAVNVIMDGFLVTGRVSPQIGAEHVYLGQSVKM